MAVVPSLLVALSSRVSEVRKSAVTCLRNIKLGGDSQDSPVSSLVKILLESAEDLAADSEQLKR